MNQDAALFRQIRVRVKLLGYLSQYIESATIDLDCPPGTSVADLIGLLVEQMGLDFQRVTLDPYGNLHGGLEIVLDGEHIPARHIKAIFLSKDCELILIPMISGGGQDQ